MPKRKPKATRAPGAGRPNKYGERMVRANFKLPESQMALLQKLAAIDKTSPNEVLIYLVYATHQYRWEYPEQAE